MHALCYTAIVIGYVSCSLGIVAKKLAGIENMIMIQVFWLSFLWLNSTFYTPFSQVFPIKYATGFGISLISNPENKLNSILSLNQQNLLVYIQKIS